MRARLLLPLLGLPLLAGCGFTPMYASGGLVGPALATVAVDPPGHSRAGYLLREQIDDSFGRDRTQAPRYRLALTITQQRFPLGVRINNVASRYEIDLNVFWTLKDAHTGKSLTTGAATGRTSYDSADPPYSGVAAEQDGEERAASEAAVRVRYGVARWLKLHPNGLADDKLTPTPAQVAATLAPSPSAEGASALAGANESVADAPPPLTPSPPSPVIPTGPH